MNLPRISYVKWYLASTGIANFQRTHCVLFIKASGVVMTMMYTFVSTNVFDKKCVLLMSNLRLNVWSAVEKTQELYTVQKNNGNVYFLGLM